MPRKRAHGPGAPPLAPNVAALRALAHPLRLRIVELVAETPRTTKQVAELLGQPPTRLYHHVAALERAGLLRLKETRRNRGTVEKWYEATARTIGGATTGTRRGESRATKRAVALTVLEQSRQEVVTAIDAGGSEAPLLARMVLGVPPSRIPEVRTRLLAYLEEIAKEFRAASDEQPDEPDERGDRWALTMTFAATTPARSPR